jgi:hypothetical protein
MVVLFVDAATVDPEILDILLPCLLRNKDKLGK